jgi:hypothetical protein
MTEKLTIIGRAERADIPDLGVSGVPVKIDTGADACSIWAHATEVRGDTLHVVFFDETSGFYTGHEHVFPKDEFTVTRVANSFGHREVRYKVKLGIRINGRKIKGTFTLSDRSTKLYPILIGRSLLYNKFLVDVSKGNPLATEERERAEKLRRDMKEIQGDL